MVKERRQSRYKSVINREAVKEGKGEEDDSDKEVNTYMSLSTRERAAVRQ